MRVEDIAGKRGPVLVTIEHRIALGAPLQLPDAIRRKEIV